MAGDERELVGGELGVRIRQLEGKVAALEAGGGGGGSKHTIKDEGTPLAARTGLNFVGSVVTATDDAANDETDVTIAAAAASHTHPESDVTNLVSDLAGKQPSDTDLSAIAALVSSPDKVPYATGAGTWALADFTAAARALMDDGTAAAMRTTLDVPSNAEAILDTLFDAKGDLIGASAADTPGRLPVGSNGDVLTADSAQALGIKWAAAAGGGIAATIVDAKGDLIVATAADTVARQAVGTNGDVLTADSAQSTGVKWAAPSAGSDPRLVRKRKSADQIKNANVTLGDITDLGLPVAANEVWLVDLFLLLSATGTAADWKFGFTGPALSQFYWGNESAAVAGSTIWGGNVAGASGVVLKLLADNYPFGSVNGIHGQHLFGIYVGGANAGTLQPQFAQNTSTAADSKVLANSILRAFNVT